MPVALRKRGPRATQPSNKALPRHNGNRFDEKKGRHRGRPSIFIVAAAALLLLGIAYLVYQRLTSNTAHDDNAIHLPTIETLTNVPLGFSFDLPTNIGAAEVYLDSRLVAAIDDPAPMPVQDGHAFSFGTCDISDHGGNFLNHSFSLGRGQLENMRSILLKPGEHVVEIEQRKDNRLLPYARMKVQVDSPPELVIGPSLFGGTTPYEDAYKLAMKEMGNNIACNHFVAGTGWSQLWTRDTSFAAELGAALVHPQVVKQSLMASVEKYNGKNVALAAMDDATNGIAASSNVWLQDQCGHFGGWPNLSDAIVGVRGAWSLYLVTGDKEMLSWAYDVTKNSLERAEREVFEHHSGLFKGCSSFLESNSGYPEKYMNDGERVGKTKALSTNMLYYSGYNLASKMGRELGEPDDVIRDLEEKALHIKDAIRSRLWVSSKNNYAYFEDEYGKLVDTTEGLGISLALLDFSDDTERNNMILESTRIPSEYGITCLWPQFKYSPGFFEWRIPRHYHNGRLWPFVQGYWAMAVAHHGRVDLFSDALKGLTSLAQSSNTFAEFYELNATYPEERRSQLWSATGYISMIYHGVFGIRLGLDGIRFSPMKPKDLFGNQPTIHLNKLQYRGMVLNIRLHGHGTTVDSFELNDRKQSEAFIKSDKIGMFDVDINLV